MTKLSSAVKRRITRDWHTCLAELGEYQPMWLIKRAGCLLVGVHLERDSSNSCYLPTFHTHVLGKKFPAVSLTLAHPLLSRKNLTPEVISVVAHQEKFEEACERLRTQAPLSLSGPLRWTDVLAAYMGQIRKVSYPLGLYEDLIVVAAWWGPPDDARVYFETVADQLLSWPKGMFADGYERWRETFEQLVTDREKLEASVSDEVARFRLGTVPTLLLEWDL
jgi:hypothetical protein